MRLFEQIRLGTGWFRDSLKTVRLQPLSFTAVVIAYAGIMGLLGLIPIVGIVFAGFFWPFGTIMIAGAGRDTLAGKIPSTRPLAESFAKPDTRLRLVRAGILYSIVLVTAAAIWQFLGADEIAQWQITKDDRVVWSSALQHIPYGAIIASTAFYIPCMMAMWFTPLLIYLKNMTIGKALFYSFTGCLTNLAAVITALFLAFFTFSVSWEPDPSRSLFSSRSHSSERQFFTVPTTRCGAPSSVRCLTATPRLTTRCPRGSDSGNLLEIIHGVCQPGYGEEILPRVLHIHDAA